MATKKIAEPKKRRGRPPKQKNVMDQITDWAQLAALLAPYIGKMLKDKEELDREANTAEAISEQLDVPTPRVQQSSLSSRLNDKIETSTVLQDVAPAFAMSVTTEKHGVFNFKFSQVELAIEKLANLASLGIKDVQIRKTSCAINDFHFEW